MDIALLKDIKFNCDVSDARFWGSFSICGLLMRYRDLYRSEQRREPWAAVSSEEIGPWIQQKESRWPELEGQPFRDLVLQGRRQPAHIRYLTEGRDHRVRPDRELRPLDADGLAPARLVGVSQLHANTFHPGNLTVLPQNSHRECQVLNVDFLLDRIVDLPGVCGHFFPAPPV